MPFLTSLFNEDPSMRIFLGIWFYLMIFVKNLKFDLSSFMEQISNFTTVSEPIQLSRIGDLSEEGWTFTICLGILTVYKIIQCLVLGTLRVSEQNHLKESLWDYFLQKSLFVLFIVDAEGYRERSHWTIWFITLGSVLLLSRLCKDRFEYLSSSPATKRWPLIKISILMCLMLIVASSCVTFASIGRHSPTHTLFLLADSLYILTFVISTLTRFLFLAYDMRTNCVWETRISVNHYGDLLFAMLMSFIDLFHHSHLLIISHFSMLIRGWCLLRIHTLIMEIRRRYRKHRNFLNVRQTMEKNYPMANAEEIADNSDHCAICWEAMESARKLPCTHLFHNSCLTSWLEQDSSCPKCRNSLKEGGLSNQNEDQSESEEEFIETTRIHPRNHLFHFDSSRYTNNPLLSWLPTISIDIGGFM